MEWIKKQEWDLSKFSEKLVDRGFSIFETEFSRYSSVEEQLSRLRSTVEGINALLKDAEERREINDDSVKLWLRQLKSVAFDSDDLHDSHQTALAVHKLKKGGNQSGEVPSRKRKWFPMELSVSFSLPSLSPEWGPFHRRRIVMEIEKIEKRLDFISRNKKNFKLRKDDGRRREMPNERIRPFQQGPSHDLTKIVGWETVLNAIVEVLTADSREVSGSTRTVPVAGIYGAAGIGKTTLARLVYHDSRVESYFDLKVWVDLTDGSDVTSVSKEIYEKMTRQRCDHLSLETIQFNLRRHLEALENKKFLIVIDNLWEEGFHFWETLRNPLLAGEEGCKVLITTQNERTCRLMLPMLPPTNLIGLGKEQCWDLFSSFALPKGVERQDDELVQVGMEIANRCYGSPLAAKTLGALLNGKDEEEWRTVLDELHVLEQDKNGILPSLLISYYHLPYPIKKCFAYCCIFPNGYLFEKDQLIRYWLAEGLLPYEGRRRLEHVGTKYFDELIWRSFFEKLLENGTNKGEKYRIPSLMHDLARVISKYEFQEMGNVSSEITETGDFRYASLLHQDGKPLPIENAYNFKKLRTLIICSKSKTPLTKVPPELFRTLRCLRVLDLSNSELTGLPEIANDQLIHLRYLGLSNTNITNLPKSVCKLYNLQTLELRGCTSLAELPEGISKLVNLRHLGFHIDWENITDKHSLHMPHGINHLSKLQTLSRFTVALYSDGKCNICELKNLELRGDLCISNLENITNHQDAAEAYLGTKQYVDRLMLRWSDGVNMDCNQLAQVCSVAESLRPNDRLRCLWFVNYPGKVFPNWLGNPSFKSLESVRISNLKCVPTLGMLLRLKDLYIEKIELRAMLSFVGYPSLEILTISDMPTMDKFIQENDIPSLQKLEVSDCPELREVVIHRNLHHDKFKTHNCTKLSQVVCVPQD